MTWGWFDWVLLYAFLIAWFAYWLHDAPERNDW